MREDRIQCSRAGIDQPWEVRSCLFLEAFKFTLADLRGLVSLSPAPSTVPGTNRVFNIV